MIRIHSDVRGGLLKFEDLSNFELAQLSTQVTREVNRRADKLGRQFYHASPLAWGIQEANQLCADRHTRALADFNDDCGGLSRAQSREGHLDVTG